MMLASRCSFSFVQVSGQQIDNPAPVANSVNAALGEVSALLAGMTLLGLLCRVGAGCQRVGINQAMVGA